METIDIMKLDLDGSNMKKWRSNLKCGDHVRVLKNSYVMLGVVIKSDAHDETTLIHISGQNTPLWHSNHNIFKEVI